MGRAAAVLGLARQAVGDGRRLAAGAALVVLLAGYDAVAPRLPDAPLWLDTALTAVALVPASFALVWLATPLRRRRGLLAVTVALALLAAVWHAAGLDVAANLAKLAAASLAGFWFLTIFERASWVVLVACVIPVVDAISVWRGPTHEIVGDRPEVFGALSIAFPSPGAGGFQLGLPDVIFFALFLATALRWKLRPGWTWTAMTAALGVTMALAVTTDPFGIGGLPALPGLSLAFLAANADLLVRARRGDVAWLVPVTLRADEPDRLARFYREALGTRAETHAADTVHVWASWAEGGPDGPTELGFETEDVADAFRRAVEAGARPSQPPANGPWGLTAALSDPTGTRVVVREPS